MTALRTTERRFKGISSKLTMISECPLTDSAENGCRQDNGNGRLHDLSISVLYLDCDWEKVVPLVCWLCLLLPAEQFAGHLNTEMESTRKSEG